MICGCGLNATFHSGWEFTFRSQAGAAPRGGKQLVDNRKQSVRAKYQKFKRRSDMWAPRERMPRMNP